MRIHYAKPLFAWDSLPDCPDIQTIRDFLQSIPDEHLLVGLRAARGKGRNKYPVRVLWGTLLLSIGLRHPSMEACLAELRRNAQLRQLLEIPTAKEVPNSWKVKPDEGRATLCWMGQGRTTLCRHPSKGGPRVIP